MKKIVSYRTALTHKLDGTWEWTCPVWFGCGIFADVTISNARQLDTKKQVMADMKKMLAAFGITKDTPRI